MILWLSLFFLLGICVGSFLNVLIYRLPKNESLFGRSHCDNCGKKLSWFELIPLVSYIFLGGRCKKCKKIIDPTIPLVEFITAFFFASLILKFPILNFDGVILLAYYLFIFSCFTVIFFIDQKKGIIPNKIIYPAITLTFVYSFLAQKIIESFLSGISASLFFFAIYFITKGKGMGFGDVKLAFLLGLFLGFPGVVFGLYLAFLTGGISSLILILWGKKKWQGDSIAFGPFLILGAIFAFFFTDRLVSLLSNFLLL